jgi:hypothetical protein
MGYTGEARWCPEASRRGDAKAPSSRGDARATGRARTGGAKSSRRDQRIWTPCCREYAAFMAAFRGPSSAADLTKLKARREFRLAGARTAAWAVNRPPQGAQR